MLFEGFYETAVDPKRDTWLRSSCISTVFTYQNAFTEDFVQMTLAQLKLEPISSLRYRWAENLFRHSRLGQSQNPLVTGALIDRALAEPFATRSAVEDLLYLKSSDPRLIDVYIKIAKDEKSTVGDYGGQALERLNRLDRYDPRLQALASDILENADKNVRSVRKLAEELKAKQDMLAAGIGTPSSQSACEGLLRK